MIASAAWRALERDPDNRPAAAAIPRFTFAIGIGTPMRPVEQTSTSRASMPRLCAVISAIFSASAIPRAPVQALAFPELTTIARADFLAAFRALTFTGAAQTWLVVNIPATAAGTSDTINARSSFRPFSEPFPVPSRLMSQKTAAALNPRGAQTEPAISRNGFFKAILRFPRNRT
jgi:hypothetical protein